MNNESTWITSTNGNGNGLIKGYKSNKYCEFDGLCYKMILNNNNNYVYITKTIKLSEIGYKYKDLNLEWSLQTNGLNDNTIFNVLIQCDNNYLYVNNLCQLKEYNINNDCIDNTCN
eukprot:265050_1